ncbi:UNVERIFIED_CONTAM: hypothetical protein FKN15_035333 [Acipenser sinensis]
MLHLNLKPSNERQDHPTVFIRGAVVKPDIPSVVLSPESKGASLPLSRVLKRSSDIRDAALISQNGSWNANPLE